MTYKSLTRTTAFRVHLRLREQVEDHISEIKLKQLEISNYKKKLIEAETKYRQQQNLFEAVRAERNAYSKSLIESQDETQELKNKLSVLSHQIEQLKEDIVTKESNLIKEEFRTWFSFLIFIANIKYH